MIRLKLAAIVIGVVLVVFGVREWQLKTVAKDTPQSISAEDLEAKGPGDNAHIVLTDFLMCPQGYVYEYKQRRGGGGDQTWTKVWVPVVPLGGPYHTQILSMLGPNGEVRGELPRPQNIKILVKSTKARNEADIEAMANADTLDGLVINKIESLGGDEKQKLAESYPGIDFSKCWIIEADRKPWGVAQVLGMMGGGGALTLAGLAWIAAGRRQA